MQNNPIDPAEFDEITRQGNATPENLGWMIAHFVRTMLNGALSGSAHQKSSVLTVEFREILEAVRRLPSEHDLFQCMQEAENCLRLDPAERRQSAWAEASEEGTKYYLALIATDNYRQARISKAGSAFRESVKWALRPDQ